jgi:hypothetical protein
MRTENKVATNTRNTNNPLSGQKQTVPNSQTLSNSQNQDDDNSKGSDSGKGKDKDDIGSEDPQKKQGKTSNSTNSNLHKLQDLNFVKKVLESNSQDDLRDFVKILGINNLTRATKDTE